MNITYNTKTVNNITYNGKEVTNITYNGKIIYEGVSSTLNKVSWNKIKEITQAGQAANYWNVGDTKDITINGSVGEQTISGTYRCVLIGINHNSSREGNNKLHFQIGKSTNGVDIAFINSNNYGQTSSNNNYYIHYNTQKVDGGWRDSNLRNNILPQFKNALETNLQNVIVQTTKWTSVDGTNNSSAMASTNDYLFLPSEYEFWGNCPYANPNESTYCQRYAYYANGASTIRYAHNNTTSSVYWWGRSPHVLPANSFCSFKANGSAHTGGSNRVYGIAPCFVVG